MDTTPQAILLQDFQRKGFTRGVVPFPELDTRILLEPNHFYREERNVIDVNQRLKEWAREFGVTDHQGYSAGVDGTYVGFYASTDNVSFAGHLILLTGDEPYIGFKMRRAHELGHLLWDIDGSENIFERLHNPEYGRRKIDNTKSFAYLCEWLAHERILGHTFLDKIRIDYALAMGKISAETVGRDH